MICNKQSSYWTWGYFHYTTQWRPVWASWVVDTERNPDFQFIGSGQPRLHWICTFSASQYTDKGLFVDMCTWLSTLIYYKQSSFWLWLQWFLMADRKSKIKWSNGREMNIKGDLARMRDTNIVWWIICIIWLICWIIHYSIVFSNISASPFYISQRMWVTGGKLWNVNKHRYSTHGYSFADFPLKSFPTHSFRYFSELRAHFPCTQYIFPSFSNLMSPAHWMALDRMQSAQ